MMIRLNGLNIAGIASVLPSSVLHIRDLRETFGAKKIERIISNTGVEEIHYVEDGVTATDLCVKAAEHLLEALSLPKDAVDGIVFVSESADYRVPGNASVAHGKLGLKKEAVAFDINYSCSGFAYGLYQAAMLINSGGCGKVLLCNGDAQTKLINPRDRSMRVLVGDAGTATLVERGSGSVIFNMKSDGSGYRHIIIPAGGVKRPADEVSSCEMEDEEGNIRSANDLFMNGMEVMKFSLREVPIAVREIMQEAGWEKNDGEIYAMHQPNKLILDYLFRLLEIEDEDAFPIALAKTGNTGSASIPLLLTQEGARLREKFTMQKVVVCGFGVGLSWGAVTADLSQTELFLPIYD